MAVVDCNCDRFEKCSECGGHGCEPPTAPGWSKGCDDCNGSGCKNWTPACDGEEEVE